MARIKLSPLIKHRGELSCSAQHRGHVYSEYETSSPAMIPAIWYYQCRHNYHEQLWQKRPRSILVVCCRLTATWTPLQNCRLADSFGETSGVTWNGSGRSENSGNCSLEFVIEVDSVCLGRVGFHRCSEVYDARLLWLLAGWAWHIDIMLIKQ